MERYSKVFGSKWQSRYSDEFKRFVCDEFISGIATRGELERKYGLGRSRLTHWLKELGYNYSRAVIVALPTMADQPINAPGQGKTIPELEKELQEVQLLAEAYRRMIEVAEYEFKIKIVKKSGTK